MNIQLETLNFHGPITFRERSDETGLYQFQREKSTVRIQSSLMNKTTDLKELDHP